MAKKLRRSKDKIIGGVIGGFADYLDVDATLLRIVVAALMIFTGIVPIALLYVISWIVMPQ